MPELPEVERARQLIETGALGRRIVEVDDRHAWVCRPHAQGEIAAALIGRTLVSAHRQGKTLWLRSDGGPELGLHLGMAGRIVIDEPASGRGWDRFALGFQDGGRLALRDRRRLGRVRLEPDRSRLGPDALHVTREDFRRRVGRGRAAIKARLLDQGTIAGVGNLLADQALWRAGLSPARPAGELSPVELDGLRRALRAETRHALRHGGGPHGEHDRRAARRRALSALRGADRASAHRRAYDVVVFGRAGDAAPRRARAASGRPHRGYGWAARRGRSHRR